MTFRIYKVSGPSMAPSFTEGAFLLVSTFSRIRLADVVVFTRQTDEGQSIKRVTGKSEAGYFVEGDNLTRSTDSRHFGAIRRDDIVGKVVCQIKPRFRWYV